MNGDPNTEMLDADLVGDLTRPSQLTSNYSQRISTDIRESVVFSQSFARWSLDRKGFLSHHSKIAIGVKPATGFSSAFFPIGIGVNSLIDRCVLKCGNRTIAETQSFGELQAYRSIFKTNEENREREQFMTQRLINHSAVYEDDPALFDTDVDAPTIGLEFGRDYQGSNMNLLPFARMDGTNATTKAESPVYSIYLGDLFDIFANQDMPLYLMDDEVHIELHFTALTGDKRVSVNNGIAAGIEVEIDQSETRMIYDTIYYSGDAMEAYRDKVNREGGLTFEYTDYRLTRRTDTKADAFKNITQSLGGAGRFVDKVIIRIGNDDKDSSKTLLNSQYCQAPPAGEERTINLRYNDRFEFPIDRSNSALLFSTMREAEGDTAFITRQEYGRESPNVLTPKTLEQHAIRGNLGGNFNWLSLRPNREERVNNQGIDLIYKNPMPTESLTLLCWIGLRKIATLKDGHFDCYFA